uniref:Centrosomal protein 152 n=1 Tax=Cynoglossus semilaevis TaxID=244447 RepID=A0A3P8W0E9_CYNSE
MSIDFDSAALQTQHEEEEYDQEDYAREQELHKLLTDLPDDMLEDSRDSSSPELEYSTCSNKNTTNRYMNTVRIGEMSKSQEPEDSNFTRGDYTYTSLDNNDLSEYEPKPYSESNGNHLEYNGEGQRTLQNHKDHNPRNQFESGTVDRGVNQYKASYNPHPAHQPKTFNSQAPHPGDHFDRLQREFLDSTQQTADKEQLAQQQILNKAKQRQIEDLEQKLEDSRRNMRYLEHQFAIVKDERESLVVNLKESRRLVEEAKEQEGHMQNKVKALEQQIQVLTERDHENIKKQRVAEAAVDSMKQQMLELCRSDTLSRTREQHDRDLTVMKEQHEAALLDLQQKLDSVSQALSEQAEVSLMLREQLKKMERQREEEQLERARIINALTKRLEDSQQQCAKLLQTSSVQEMSEVQMKLQQVQSAKALSENMNKVLQEDLADLKEQITLYESAVKHGVIALDLSNDSEHQLSESCMDLGLKKGKNGPLSDPKNPKDEAVQLLRLEMQRCLNSLKGKRQKISQLQEELQRCQSQMNKLQTQLEEAKLSSEVSSPNQKEKQHWQEQLEVELKQNEERVKSANLELCTKMREMIQELDQEKQEAAHRAERIHQQYRDDVVNRVKTELMLEHDAQIEELSDQHQQQVQQLQTQLFDVNDKLLAVQECYISVCKEKDMLLEKIDGKEKEEDLIRENEKEAERLEEVRKGKHRETGEVTCQTDEVHSTNTTFTAEELEDRLSAQKHELQLEAEKVKRKAVEEARRQVMRELQEKHLEDMAKQVEGAVTRAYSHWTEDLASLPEYQASIQREKDKWEELQGKNIEQQIAQALREAEEQWLKKQSNNVEHQRFEELQEDVASLQSQLEHVKAEQAALLKAELSAARAVWNRDKQQEISVLKVCSEQLYQSRLQEQHKKLEQVRIEADRQRKELLLQMEAKLQETLRSREEEWRSQQAEKRRQINAQAQLLKDLKNTQKVPENRRSSEMTSEMTVTHIIHSSCKDLVSRISEERLSRVLKEAQEQNEREMDKLKSKWSTITQHTFARSSPSFLPISDALLYAVCLGQSTPVLPHH